jgi:hypothetical protein
MPASVAAAASGKRRRTRSRYEASPVRRGENRRHALEQHDAPKGRRELAADIERRRKHSIDGLPAQAGELHDVRRHDGAATAKQRP